MEDFTRCVSFDFIQSISDAKFGPLTSLELPMNLNESFLRGLAVL